MKQLADRLRSNWNTFLTSRSVLALGAFLHGYRAANDAAAAVLLELASKFEGPDQADACTRAYLTIGDCETAIHAVLDALGGLNAPMTIAPGHGDASTTTTFVDVVREPILKGRTGIVLIEPTILWLADYARGYIAGLEAIEPAVARTQEQQLLAFEAWLRDEYDAGPSTPWYGIVRVYEGLCLDGLRGFLKLWDRFNASLQSESG